MKQYPCASAAMLLATAVSWSLAAPLCLAQDSTVASIVQTGAGNRAYIDQTNHGNPVSAVIVQNGNDNIIGDPDRQTGGVSQPDALSERAELRQTGNANRASLYQNGGWRTMFVLDQNGNHNVSAVRQDITPESSTRIEQTGERNRVDGDSARAFANGFDAKQVGTDNRISVFDRTSGFGGPYVEQQGVANQIAEREESSAYAFTDIHQFGERNTISSTHLASLFTDTYVDQTGADNVATLRNNAAYSLGRVRQTGEHNMASTSQQGLSSQYAITQDGVLNTASVAQNSTSWPTSNLATITQTGQRLNASLVQTGAANQGVISQ